jgi:hypothetical protein
MAVSPNRSAGLDPTIARGIGTDYSQVQTIEPWGGATLNNIMKDIFVVKYFPAEGDAPRFFCFALPPAVDQTGGGRGQNGIPEIKPGIVTNTTMKYKNFIVPGATPVVQAIGVQNTTYQFVGALIGSEEIKLSAVRTTPPEINATEEQNAHKAAQLFDRNIVQQAKIVDILIITDITYKYRGVVVNFKFHSVRAERVYYTIDLLATDYPKRTDNQNPVGSNNPGGTT